MLVEEQCGSGTYPQQVDVTQLSVSCKRKQNCHHKDVKQQGNPQGVLYAQPLGYGMKSHPYVMFHILAGVDYVKTRRPQEYCRGQQAGGNVKTGPYGYPGTQRGERQRKAQNEEIGRA